MESAERELLSLALAMQRSVQAINEQTYATPAGEPEGGQPGSLAPGMEEGEIVKPRPLQLRIGVAKGDVVAGVRL